MIANNTRNLRKLLLDLYVSGAVGQYEGCSDDELGRLLDSVHDAAEGRPFKSLGLPFPRRAEQSGA